MTAPTSDASAAADWTLLSGPWSPTATPLHLAVTVLVGALLACWVLQVSTTNYSWTDRLWSVLPPVYVGLFAWASGSDARAWLLFALSTAWGARLTFNFARKGGYDPREEDYRWAAVRAWLAAHDPFHPLGRELFSLLFIAAYQHLLIGLFCIPAAFMTNALRGQPLGLMDGVATLLFLGFLAAETVTDHQQWAFQQARAKVPLEQRAQAGGDIARGFCTTGAFRYSRHLNFLGEMGLWWAFWLFTVAAGAPWLNWALAGPVLLTLLFQGSTAMTEALSTRKYPAYREYQRTTSRLLPWPPKT